MSSNCDLAEISQYGDVWSNSFISSSTSFFLCLFKVANINHFKNFIKTLTKGKVEVHQITSDKVSFIFNQELFEEEIELFIRGLLGPDRYPEFEHLPRLYISGLDSV